MSAVVGLEMSAVIIGPRSSTGADRRIAERNVPQGNPSEWARRLTSSAGAGADSSRAHWTVDKLLLKAEVRVGLDLRLTTEPKKVLVEVACE